VVRPGLFDGFEAGLLAGVHQEPLEVDLRWLRLVALCGGRRSSFDVRGGGRPALFPVVVAAGRDAEERDHQQHREGGPDHGLNVSAQPRGG
jgi:hypothetical protein